MPHERIHVYELTEPLTRGGPGRVHRGRVAEAGGPLETGHPVVLRTVSLAEAGDEHVLQRLVETHAAARRIDCPGVLVPVDHGLSTGAAGRQFWSVAPWVEGRTLAEIAAGVDFVPDALTEAFLRPVAEAIRAAHAAGLVGLAISPASVLVRSDGAGMLADPGFGPAAGPDWPAAGRPPATMMCASPDVLDGGAPDRRDDLYALGAILFRCMTGGWHRPEDARALLLHARQMDAERPNDVRPRCSLFLSEVAFALLRADRSQRIASAEDLVEILSSRRRGAWWRTLHIDQDTHDDEPATRRPLAPEPAPPPIPEPAPPPDEDWWARCGRVPAPSEPHAGGCVGRDAEIALLLDTALRLRDRGGSVAFVTGGAGVGKTRLLDAFLDRVRELPAHRAPVVLRGESRRAGVGRPLGAFTEALTGWLTGHRIVEARDVAPLLGEAAGIAPAFAAALSSEAPPAGSLPLGRDSLGPAFLRCLRTISARAPVVVLVENLQWADPEVLDLFAFLARAGAELPVLLVGTHRPAPDGGLVPALVAGVRATSRCVDVPLAPFDPARLGHVAREIVAPAGIAAELAVRLHASLGGAPGAMMEALRALESEGALVRRSDGKLEAREPLVRVALPATVAEAADRRLAALAPRESALLAAAVVQGVAFDAEVARLAAGLDARTATQALEDLAARSIVAGDGIARRFHGQAVHERVLAKLDDAALADRHEATAAAFLASRNPDQLPPSRIHGMLSYRVAWHYMLSGRGARGLLYVSAAVAHLRATFRHGDGERLTALASRSVAGDPARESDLIDLLLERSRFLGAQGRAADQSEALGAALVRARERRDLLRESRILAEQARANRALGNAAQSDADAKQALACAHRAGESEVELRVHVWLAQTAYRESRWQDSRAHWGEALEIARRRSDGAAEAEVHHGLGQVSLSLGALEQAEEEFQQALASERARKDLVREAETLSCLGNLSAVSGDLVRAEGCLRRALAIHVALGDGAGETRALGLLAMVLQDGGCLVEALDAHRTCLERARCMDSRSGEVVALLNLATVALCLARIDDARDAYGEALRCAREMGDARLQGYALTGLGDVARQCADPAVARDLLHRATLQFRASQDPSGLAAAQLAAGRVECLFGEAGPAKALLHEAHRLAEQQSARQVGVMTHSFLALLAARRGDAAEAERRLAEAALAVSEIRVSDATRTEMIFVHSLVLRVLARHDEADRHLFHAEALLVECTRGLPDADRDRVFTTLSPFREIVAGADAARARQPAPAPSASDTAPV